MIHNPFHEWISTLTVLRPEIEHRYQLLPSWIPCSSASSLPTHGLHTLSPSSTSPEVCGHLCHWVQPPPLPLQCLWIPLSPSGCLGRALHCVAAPVDDPALAIHPTAPYRLVGWDHQFVIWVLQQTLTPVPRGQGVLGRSTLIFTQF